MKQTASIKRLGLSLLAAIGCLSGQAQTVLNTAYTNSPGNVTGNFTAPATPQYVTFTVKNTNCYPITLTEFSILHMVDVNVTFGSVTVTVSNNGAVYTVLRQTSGGITSDPSVSSAISTWPIVGSSSPITAGSSGIIPVVTGLTTNNLTEIGAGQEVRFAIVSNDTMFVRAGIGQGTTPAVIPSPRTFTLNGVTLLSVDPTDFVSERVRYGRYPNLPLNSQAPIPANPAIQSFHYGFDGGVTFKRSGPTVAVINNNACDTSGDSVTLVATIPVPPGCVTNPVFHWSGPGIIGNPTSSTVKIYASLANAGKYLCWYTAGTETSATTSATVNVTPRPKAPKITTKNQYCIGEPFQPVIADGQNILWYTIPFGGTGTTVPPYVNTNMAGSYTWYASQTVGNCEGPRSAVTITVAPIPVRPTVVSPVVFCENEPASPLSAGGTGLIWYVDPVGGLGSVIAPVPGTSVKDTLTWYVSQKIDGCEGPRSKIDVIVTFKPNGMVLVSDTPWICQHDELTFTYFGSATEFTGITWKVPSPAATSVGGGIGLDPITIRFDSAGLQQVIMSANNLGCIGDPFVQYVTVKPIPYAFINAPSDVCPNDDRIVVLDEFSPGIDTFKFNWDGGVTTHFATDQGPYGVMWSTPGRKVIKLTMVQDLCVGEATDTVDVRNLPDATINAFYDENQDNNFDGFDAKKALICSGDSLRLEAKTIVVSSKYEWTPTRFFDNAANLPVTYGRIDFSGFVTLKVTDELGCVSMDSIKLVTKPCCEIAFPTAFTPNGDGKNDIFRAISPGHQDTRTFQIVNRYGQVVYENVNAEKGWDGMMKGEPADMGTYFYHINFKCDNKWTDQKGEFILVR
ncbi:T9SS type B sorting domain-containing protein [Polluticoccus soli]|uniref:T9SS type B sorting domain-containing protein n=1 Tax=Polluticoccus soli TaxID=3034150 RepID=UPI0023E216E7|nr:T9SS type B sorting domain-containing protein [Flavipsychrobacter sp. JY13-12]